MCFDSPFYLVKYFINYTGQFRHTFNRTFVDYNISMQELSHVTITYNKFSLIPNIEKYYFLFLLKTTQCYLSGCYIWPWEKFELLFCEFKHFINIYIAKSKDDCTSNNKPVHQIWQTRLPGTQAWSNN